MKTGVRTVTHWPDAGSLLLAFWLFVSPWVMNYSPADLSAWNGFVAAVIIAIFAVAAMLKFAKWEEWINIIVGLWLIASPWILGYSATTAAMWNHLGIGVLIVLLAGWELDAAEQAASTT